MIAVRAAEPDDADMLARLHAQTWREAYWGHLPDSAVRGEMRGPAYWRAQTVRAARDPAARDYTLLVAEAGGDGVGFSWCGPSRGNETPWQGEIYMLYVLNERQRRGAGRALLAAAANHLIQRGFFSVGLWCVESNGPARAFYEELGGTVVARGVQVVGGVRVDVVGYVWRDEVIADADEETPPGD